MTDWSITTEQGVGFGIVHDGGRGELVLYDGDKAESLAQFYNERSEIDFVAVVREMTEALWGAERKMWTK